MDDLVVFGDLMWPNNNGLIDTGPVKKHSLVVRHDSVVFSGLQCNRRVCRDRPDQRRLPQHHRRVQKNRCTASNTRGLVNIANVRTSTVTRNSTYMITFKNKKREGPDPIFPTSSAPSSSLRQRSASSALFSCSSHMG